MSPEFFQYNKEDYDRRFAEAIDASGVESVSVVRGLYYQLLRGIDARHKNPELNELISFLRESIEKNLPINQVLSSPALDVLRRQPKEVELTEMLRDEDRIVYNDENGQRVFCPPETSEKVLSQLPDHLSGYLLSLESMHGYTDSMIDTLFNLVSYVEVILDENARIVDVEYFMREDAEEIVHLVRADVGNEFYVH